MSGSFMGAFRGNFTNMLRWEQLDELWAAIQARTDTPWYVYAVGEPPPTQPADPAELAAFLSELGTLLRREHDEDYCGIVYADDQRLPSMVKVYDPNHLGSACGSGSREPPLPGWVLSVIPPTDLKPAHAIPGNRRRWWYRLFGVRA